MSLFGQKIMITWIFYSCEMEEKNNSNYVIDLMFVYRCIFIFSSMECDYLIISIINLVFSHDRIFSRIFKYGSS